MYTHQHAREQIPGLAKKLNKIMADNGSTTSIEVTIADGFYDIQTVTSKGYRVLLIAALDPMSAWRQINILIDFMRQSFGE